MLVKNMTELIGNTPLLQLERYKAKKQLHGSIYAKMECFEPLSSVKDRVALKMITEAEKSSLLKEGGTIVEPTSGNTGLGLAFIAATRGYKMILVMPESMSIERRKLAAMLGAKVVLTPAAEGMKGSIAKAEEIVAKTEGAYMPSQFNNKNNVEAHRQTTAVELLKDLENNIDIFVAGVGTGGTITGVGEELKKQLPHVQIVAVEPDCSAVLSGLKAGAHKLQGIGAGFIPSILNTSIYDLVIQVSAEEAYEATRQLALTEGALVGISSGAALHAATILAAKPENKDKRIVVLLPDTGERYLSTPLFDF